MILFPLNQSTTVCARAAPEPAWEAVARRQRQCADSYWLVSQPDHAALAGDLAANFVAPEFPQLDESVVRAIAVHDAGWAIFESEAGAVSPPILNGDQKPLSFVELPPSDFTRAWTASIDRAEEFGPAGGLIVSCHFYRLGEFRRRSAQDSPAESELLGKFLAREEKRQKRLCAAQTRSPGELDALVEVLQFCDLLSLYLCCGATEEVEFPQQFSGHRVRLHREDGACVLDPSPFRPARERPAQALSLGVKARSFSRQQCDPRTTTLAFLLW